MSITYTGQRLSQYTSYRFDPERGLLHTVTIKGQADDVSGMASVYRNAGYNVNGDFNGPYWSFTAERIRTTSLWPYREEWTTATETVSKSIFSHPKVMAEADSYPGGAAQYQKDVRRAAGPEGFYAAALASTTQSDFVIELLQRGGEDYEYDYLVLTRSVQVAQDFAGGSQVRLDLKSKRYIYTTAQLQALYPIPADVLFSLPPAGTNNTDTMWGWRLRDQNAELNDSLEARLHISWAWAEWLTLSYDAAP